MEQNIKVSEKSSVGKMLASFLIKLVVSACHDQYVYICINMGN